MRTGDIFLSLAPTLIIPSDSMLGGISNNFCISEGASLNNLNLGGFLP